MRRLAARAGVRAAASLLPWLLLGLALLEGAGRLGFLEPRLLPAAVAGACVLLAAALAVALLAAPSRIGAALLLDRRLGAREVVTAAAEAGPDATHPLALEARRRAEALLGSRSPAAAFPLTALRAWRGAALAAVLFSLVPWLRPLAPAASSGPAAEPVLRAGEELARQIARMEGRIGPAAPEAARAMERLRQAAEQMRTGELRTPEQALLALEKVEGAAAFLRDEAEGGALRGGLADLLKDLSKDPFAGELGRAIASGEREALRRALEGMANALPADRAEAAARAQETGKLADRLEEMALLLRGSGEEEAAKVLRELAEAIRSGDMASARRILGSGECRQACGAAGRSLAESAMARDLLELVQAARYLVGSGDPIRLGEGPEGLPGCPGGRGAGPHPGRGTTNEEAEGGYATGERILRDRRSSETGSKRAEYEALYGPQLSEAEGWQDVQARGELGTSGELLSETGLALGVPGGARLPLDPSLAAAPGAPEGAGDTERVPPGYREIVRRYFTRSQAAGAGAAGGEAAPAEGTEAPAGGPDGGGP